MNTKSQLNIFSLLLLLFTCFLGTTGVQAQREKAALMLQACPKKDSIMLRWGPDSYRLWIIGNKYGYHVTRTLLLREGKYVEHVSEEYLTEQAVKPMPLPAWEILAETDNYAGVAAQAIYGDDLELETDANQSDIIDIVNKASLQESKYGFALFAADQSVKVASYSGLYYVDKNVKKNEKYLYKVFPAFVPENMKVDTAYYFTGIDEYAELPAPLDVEAEAGDKMVTITWNRKYQESLYNSFWVEKSIDKGKSFQRVNKSPLVNTTPEGVDESDFAFLIDTLVNNEQQYLYRVVGISLFGELSPPSKEVQVQGKNIIRSVPVVSLKRTKSGQKVEIRWELPDSRNEKIEGYRIYRSEEYADGYQLIKDSISLLQTHFIDQSPDLTSYYRMQAYNSDGVGAYSIPKMIQLVDSIPPEAPKGIRAVIDTSGRVQIKWDANKEKDLLGYRVYRANARHEEFSQLTKNVIEQNSYIDHINIKTLTKKVFYRIMAVDMRQNQSAFSSLFELERPDVVPPASPLIIKIEQADNGIQIKWIPSSSKDVFHQILYCNEKGKREWIVKKQFSAQVSEFKDTLVKNESTYRYLLIAVDKAGNESSTQNPVTIKYSTLNENTSWLIPKVKTDRKKGGLNLKWIPPVYEVERYMIYYKNTKGVWRLLDGVDATQLRYFTRVNGKEFKVFCKRK